MFSIVLSLITIVCFLLIIAVMVQNPKGGGLSSSFGGSQLLGGVQKTTDLLDRSTWVLAFTLMALIFLSSMCFPSQNQAATDESKSAPTTEAPAKQATPKEAAPAPAKK